MAKTERGTPPVIREEDNRRNGKWLYLLFLLFLIALISSGIVGYLLGLKAGPVEGGQLIDTILLAPEDEPDAKPEVSTILHLTGHVRYSDATPAAHRTLELHSDPMRIMTDSLGNFLFHHVPMGEHSLSVLNDDGSVAARRDIVLDRKQDAAGISIKSQESGVYTVELAVNVRMLEIAIELDDQDYYINPEYVTYETVDGMVVTPTGRASVLDGPVVTPAGNVCLSDGTIVLPGRDAQTPVAVILPDDTVVYPEGVLNAGEVQIAPDGTVTLPDGTVVTQGGNIVRPDGQSYVPGGSGVIITEEDVIPVGGAGQEAGGSELQGTETDGTGQDSDEAEEESSAQTVPESLEGQTEPSYGGESGGNGTGGDSVPGESTTASGNGTGSQGETGGNQDGDSGNQGGSHGGDSGTTGPTRPEMPEEPSTGPSAGDPDRGSLDVLGQVGGTAEYLSWTQTDRIDLFYNRDNPDSPVQPGAKGFYRFRLKNTRKEPLAITLTLAEDGNHLPLEFVLTPMSGDKISAKGSLEGYRSSLELKTAIDADAETDFRLDWEWPPEGHNEEDTKAGRKGGTYILTLTIHAEGENQ